MYHFTNSFDNNFWKNNPVLLSSHMLLCYKRWYVSFYVQFKWRSRSQSLTSPIQYNNGQGPIYKSRLGHASISKYVKVTTCM